MICNDITDKSVNIRNDIINILKELDFNTNTLGYSYLLDCIITCIESKNKLVFKMKELYSNISSMSRVNTDFANDKKIKWNIDKTIKTMINNTGRKRMEKFFQNTNLPTSKMLINRVLEIYYQN